MTPVLERKIREGELGLLEEIFGSKNKVAELLDVDRSAITRWNKGENPDDGNSIKLAALNYLISILKMEFNQTAIVQWFHATNVYLQHQRPVDFIMTGKVQPVIDAALQDVSGSYA